MLAISRTDFSTSLPRRGGARTRFACRTLSLAIAGAVAMSCSKSSEPADSAETSSQAAAAKQAAEQPETAAKQTGDKAGKQTFIYVSPDPLGVNPFLLMGKTGIERAAAKHGAEVRVFESQDPSSRQENMRAAVAEGATLIAALGFQFNDIIGTLARKHPDIEFLLVDQCVDDRPDNLHCATFREYETAFLLGAAAAHLSKSGRLGVVAALDIPFFHRFTDGFANGAKHEKADINVDVRWVGGQNPFADPVRAKEQALALAATGVDIVFSATSGGDYGVFEAAAEKEFFLMGVDVDHCKNAPGRMYDSGLKKLDAAMVEAVDAILAGGDKVTGSYGLKEGGGSMVAFDAEDMGKTGCMIAQHPEVVAKVATLRDEIVAGSLTIADPMFATE